MLELHAEHYSFLRCCVYLKKKHFAIAKAAQVWGLHSIKSGNAPKYMLNVEVSLKLTTNHF